MYNFIKRIFDIFSSLFALVVLCPLWLVIITGIKISSKGPIFYISERIGKNKKPFALYKFRSMHVFHSDDKNKKNEGGYIANADRIFPFGGFLRKSKLDEMPQLLNVLLGDMSVVGPRPITITSINRDYVGRYKCLLDVKPGLSCLDSLFDYAHGELFTSREDEYKAKVLPIRYELARMYVERKSIWLDLYCIFRTIKLMFQIAIFKKKKFQYTKYEAEAEKIIFGNSAN